MGKVGNFETKTFIAQEAQSFTGGLGSISLKVTPEELIEKSQEASHLIKYMREHFEELKRVIDKTEWYWRGKAGDKHRKAYKELDCNIWDIMDRFSEHPRDLIDIAQTYLETEMIIEDIATELPGDILL